MLGRVRLCSSLCIELNLPEDSLRVLSVCAGSVLVTLELKMRIEQAATAQGATDVEAAMKRVDRMKEVVTSLRH